MKKIMEYIESSFDGYPQTDSLYKFKQNLISEFTDRANELTHSGLSDSNVITDLIIDEHPDLKKEYDSLIKEEKLKKRKKRNRVLRVVISAMYFLFALLAFLVIGFATGAWGKTWVILVTATLLFISYIIILIVKSLTRRKSMFHPVSRILLAVNVFIYATVAFLILFVVFRLKLAWLAFIFGVLVMMSVDGIYAEKAAERFAIFFHIGYIIPASVMFYIIFISLGLIPAHPGWIMIPASLLIVLAVILARIFINNKDTELEETEDDSEWKEN